MNVTTVGIDLAKSVFAICEGDSRGHAGRSSLLKGGAFLKWLGTLPAGTIVAMEACSSAHSWGRTMQALGLEPRLIAAEFVRPYRKNKRVKNDTRDAEAVLTASHAPGMRFVTLKTEEQQQRLAWHRLREGWKTERTALFNRIRGLLTEFGIVVELGATKIRRKFAELESDSAYPQSIQLMAQSVREQVGVLDKRLAECERQIAQQSKSDPAVIRLRSRPGIGPLTADAPMRLSPRWVMRVNSRMVVSLPPVWGLRRANTGAAARRIWEPSPGAAIRICAVFLFRVRAVFCKPRFVCTRTSRIR